MRKNKNTFKLVLILFTLLSSIFVQANEGDKREHIETPKKDVLTIAPYETVKVNPQIKLQGTDNAVHNAIEGAKFLQRKSLEENIQLGQSGLLYTILKKGKGLHPSENDDISILYSCRLINGTTVSAAVDPTAPTELKMEELVPGLRQGLELMPEGSKYRFFVPSALAYGPPGLPKTGIGPNDTLIYDVELFQVSPKSVTAAPLTEKHSTRTKPPQWTSGEPSTLPPPIGMQPESNTPPSVANNPKFTTIRVNFQGFSLATIERASLTFLKLRNDLIPVSRDIDMEAICSSVSAQSFVNDCQKILKRHVHSLIEKKIGSAQFTDTKINDTNLTTGKVHLSWKEAFSNFQNNKKTNMNKSAEFTLKQEGDEWQLISAIFK